MRLGIISDTHGHLPFTTDGVRMLQQQQVDAVLHCGDIGSANVIPLFTGTPTHFVFGNCDYETASMKAAIRDANLHCHDRFGDIELEGCRIALLHGDDGFALESAIHGGDYDLGCHGHTHEVRLEQVNNTLVLNPGAMYRAEPHTIATIELPSMQVRHIPVPPA